MKKIIFWIVLSLCLVCASISLKTNEDGTFEEKVLERCGVTSDDIKKINVMYVDETEVKQYLKLEKASQVEGFLKYFSGCIFIESKTEVYSSHTIQVAAPEKNTWFYLYIDNNGKYIEIQWFGPGNDDGAAVFKSNTILSVSELLKAMNVD